MTWHSVKESERERERKLYLIFDILYFDTEYHVFNFSNFNIFLFYFISLQFISFFFRYFLQRLTTVFVPTFEWRLKKGQTISSSFFITVLFDKVYFLSAIFYWIEIELLKKKCLYFNEHCFPVFFFLSCLQNNVSVEKFYLKKNFYY